MKLYDALKSGKPFKRKHSEIYLDPKDMFHPAATFNVLAILAEDWEVKNEPIVFDNATWFYGHTRDENNISRLVPNITDVDAQQLGQFVGKRTRVTIEVLE